MHAGRFPTYQAFEKTDFFVVGPGVCYQCCVGCFFVVFFLLLSFFHGFGFCICGFGVGC